MNRPVHLSPVAALVILATFLASWAIARVIGLRLDHRLPSWRSWR